MEQRPSILFRCDGSPEIGLGHESRCLALAQVLRRHHGCDIAFAMRQDSAGFSMIEQQGYPVWWPSNSRDSKFYDAWLIDVIGRVKAEVLVLDVRDDLARITLQEIRRQGKLVVAIDDPSERRLDADLVFYPPVPQVHKLNWSGFAGQLHVGWEWIILRDEFTRPFRKSPQELPVILVSMGGSDPEGMTLTALQALEEVKGDFQVVVVLGQAFRFFSSVANWVETTELKVDVRVGVHNMSELMSQSDLALSSFGGTAYELAAMGVPALYLCLTPDHMESAQALDEQGVGICLGLHKELEPSTITHTVRHFLANAATRASMASKGKHLIDGLGAHRIANLVMLTLQSSSRPQVESCVYQSS